MRLTSANHKVEGLSQKIALLLAKKLLARWHSGCHGLSKLETRTTLFH